METNKNNIFLDALLELTSEEEPVTNTSEIKIFLNSSRYNELFDWSDVNYRISKYGDGKYYPIDGKGWIDVERFDKEEIYGIGEKIKTIEIVDREKIKDSVNEDMINSFDDIEDEVKSLRNENEELKKRMKAFLFATDKAVDDKENFISKYKEELSEIED